MTVGGRSSAGVWITNGLKAGEQIVTQGAYGVSDSAKVETSGNGKADAEPKKEVDTKPGEPVKKTDAASKKS